MNVMEIFKIIEIKFKKKVNQVVKLFINHIH